MVSNEFYYLWIMPWNEIEKLQRIRLFSLILLLQTPLNKGENTIYNVCFSSEIVVIYKIETMLNRKKQVF